jgi:hypothetical protein
MNVIARNAPLVLLCGLVFAPAAQAAEGDGWNWIVAPYVWGVGINTDVHTGRPPDGGFSSDIDFNDVLDDFDGAFEVHAEGQGEHWGVFTDFTYLGLAAEHDQPRFHTKSDLDARLFELAAVWNPGEGRYQGLDVFGGLRYIDLNFDLQLEPENPLFNTTRIDAGDSYSDFMLGARYTWALTDKWGLTLRGDGSWGQTEGTWNASAIANYKMTIGAWYFGYRYLSAELKTGDVDTDLTVSGPIVGYGFVF